MSEAWRVAQGSSLTRTVTLRDEDGNPVAFTGSEALGGAVWAGRDDPPLVALAPAWSDPAAGQCAVTVAAADTLPLGAGLYRLVLTADGDDAFEASLEVTWAPGSAPTPRVYCSYADLLAVAPWVAAVADPESDEAGFLRQRVQARQELDDAIVANYPGGGAGQFGAASRAALGWSGGVPGSYLIRQYLNSGFLMGPNADNPTADRPQTARVCAYRAAALVGLGQLGRNNAHASFGALCQCLYERELCGYTAELDTNGDGFAEIAVRLGGTNPLFT